MPNYKNTLASDGLGPLYNARACQSCHIKDGRGHPPAGPGETAVSMFLRVSIPADAAMPRWRQIADYIATAPDPVYGGQLQDFGTAGHPAEYRLDVTYQEVHGGAVRRRDRQSAAPDLCRHAPGLWPAAPRCHASPARRPPDDRAWPAGGDPGRRHPGARRSRTTRTATASPGVPNIVWSVEYDLPMLGRFGLQGRGADDPRTVRRGLCGRHRHIHPAVPAPLGRLHARHRPVAVPPSTATMPGRTGRGGRRQPRPRDLLQPQPRRACPARRSRRRGAARQGGVPRHAAAPAATSPPSSPTA